MIVIGIYIMERKSKIKQCVANYRLVKYFVVKYKLVSIFKLSVLNSHKRKLVLRNNIWILLMRQNTLFEDFTQFSGLNSCLLLKTRAPDTAPSKV